MHIASKLGGHPVLCLSSEKKKEEEEGDSNSLPMMVTLSNEKDNKIMETQTQNEETLICLVTVEQIQEVLKVDLFQTLEKPVVCTVNLCVTGQHIKS